MIPKSNGGERPLGIPTVADRVVQMAAVLVLEPIFEADLLPEQHAYRPGRSALGAVIATHKLVNTGHREVVDADLSGYFDSIPHEPLLKSVARRVSDGSMPHLIKMWLQMPVEEEDDRGRRHRTTLPPECVHAEFTNIRHGLVSGGKVTPMSKFPEKYAEYKKSDA